MTKAMKAMIRGKKISALLMAGLVLAGCGEEQAEAPVRSVRVMTIGGGERITSRSWPGRAKATQEVNLAFEVSGRLIERPVDIGDKVTAGDVLARLDPRDFQNALDASTAARNQAAAYRSRIARAVKSGAVSQQEYDDAEAKLEVAQADVKIKAKALEDSVLIAPFDGTISAAYVENFQNVRAKESMLRLLDTSKIEMIINIPEGLITLAPYVKDIQVRFDAVKGVLIPAEIKEISNEASLTTRTYPITLIMSPPPGVDVLPGMAGEATAGSVEAPGDAVEREGHEVPVSAIFSEPGGETQATYVWLVDPETKTVSKRAVKQIGFGAAGALVQGLQPGDVIAIAGVHYLREGQQVLLRDES
jgi:RND family efflux transporter MFP subunit